MYIIIFNIIISFLYLFLRTRKNIHVLQQNFYNENNRYIKWGKTNLGNVFKLDYFIFLIALVNLLFNLNWLLFINIFTFLLILNH